MRIPETKIEEIRSSVNIVDIISEYVPLRKRGKNFLGLCPFHNEKTPSFTVNEEKQIYHCFGCHNGGNVYKFLMEYEKISFIEAVQDLAGRLGIILEFDENVYEEKQSEQEILYDINTEAARYFSNNLLNNSDGEIAKEYFNKRKIKPQTMRAFGLGYAFNGWENFVQFAREKKFDIEKIIQLGLIGRNNDGRLYDKFSGRIIFPIFSPNGRVVAFAGRILENKEGTAKYLNSPESLIYSKGKILYGLSFAKDEIRRQDKAILVEGYMDLISLYQNGIKNVIAVSGTALTEDQVLLLSRYTKNVILLFDADTAGIKASMRSIELLLKKDMEIKIVSLPSGEDPDSYVNNYGKEKFEDLIKYAQNFLEFQTLYYESIGMFDDPSKTSEAIKDLIKPVAIIGDEIKRVLLIKDISKKFNLRFNLLENELNKQLSRVSKSNITKISRENSELQKPEIPKTEISIPEDIILLERTLIWLLFQGDSRIVKIIYDDIKVDDFISTTHKFLAGVVFDSFINNNNVDSTSLISKIEDAAVQTYIRDLLIDKYSVSKKMDDYLETHTNDELRISLAHDSVNRFRIGRLIIERDKYHAYLSEISEQSEEKDILQNILEIDHEIRTITRGYGYHKINLNN